MECLLYAPHWPAHRRWPRPIGCGWRPGGLQTRLLEAAVAVEPPARAAPGSTAAGSRAGHTSCPWGGYTGTLSDVRHAAQAVRCGGRVPKRPAADNGHVPDCVQPLAPLLPPPRPPSFLPQAKANTWKAQLHRHALVAVCSLCRYLNALEERFVPSERTGRTARLPARVNHIHAHNVEVHAIAQVHHRGGHTLRETAWWWRTYDALETAGDGRGDGAGDSGGGETGTVSEALLDGRRARSPAGDAKPGGRALAPLASLLGLPPPWLLVGDDTPQSLPGEPPSPPPPDLTASSLLPIPDQYSTTSEFTHQPKVGLHQLMFLRPRDQIPSELSIRSESPERNRWLR